MKEVDVILVHGIRADNEVEETYTPFVNAIRKKLPLSVNVNFHPVNWNYLLYEKERKIYEWVKDMGWPKLRQFACFQIADILAYAPPEGIPVPGDFYYDANKLLEDTFDMVAKSHPKTKKIIFSHSLGTQLSFGFCWKREVDVLFTCGSPILYFSVRFKDFGRFPEATLHKMVNFWKYGDPVATRISRNPNLSKCEDVRVESWNPKYSLPLKAHGIYWTHPKVIDRVVQEILA